MTTSQHSTRQITLDELISLQEASPVSPSAQLERDKVQKMSATSGLKCLESFERLSRATLWGRMFVGLLIGQGDWYSKRCALTWKLKGTKSYRYYFQLLPSTLPIEEIESGLSLIGTPTSTSGIRSEKFKKGRTPTPIEVAAQWKGLMGMLPTPRTVDVEGGAVKNVKNDGKGYYRENKKGVRWGVKLRDVDTDIKLSERGDDNRKDGRSKQTERIKSFSKPRGWEEFPTQPPICGGNDGLPKELDGITFPKWRKESIKAYGNAIVPQVAYEIFKAINKIK
jgi:hypothetical protein